MSDQEILNILKDIKPESYDQYEKLSKCLEIWSDDYIDFTDDYVSMLKINDVLDRSCTEVYGDYKDWCTLNYIPVVSMTRFNKHMKYRLNVSTKSCNGKRCYCE
jgi:hypothetical protein